jgi:hypothetical protein
MWSLASSSSIVHCLADCSYGREIFIELQGYRLSVRRESNAGVSFKRAVERHLQLVTDVGRDPRQDGLDVSRANRRAMG